MFGKHLVIESNDLYRAQLESKDAKGIPSYFKIEIGLYDCAWLDGFRCVTTGGETSDDWDNPYVKEREWAYQAWKAGALAGESYNEYLAKEIRVREEMEIDDRKRN